MFYKKLRALCVERDTSPSAVALAIGISKSNVTVWKSGKYPKVETLMKIAEHLEVDAAELLPTEEDEE